MPTFELPYLFHFLSMIVDCMINFYSYSLAYLVVQNKDRVALIVVSWHPGWEEVETESGNAREKFLNKG